MVPKYKFCASHWDDVRGAQQVCRDASTETLAFLSSLFDPSVSELAHGDSSVLPGQNKPVTIQERRATNAFLGRQVHIKELELEALRLSVVKKQDELREARNLHQNSLADTNKFLTLNGRNPGLPIDVVQNILNSLCVDEGQIRNPFEKEVRIPNRSCVSRLLESPIVSNTWKAIIWRQSPPEATMRLNEKSATTSYKWQISDIRRDHYRSSRRNLKKVPDGAKPVVDARNYLNLPSKDIVKHFKPSQKFNWGTLVIPRDRDVLKSIVQYLGPSLRTVHTLEMVKTDGKNKTTSGDEDKGKGTNVLGKSRSPFEMLDFAAIACKDMQFCSPLFTRLTRLNLSINLSGLDAQKLIANFRSIPPSVKYLTLATSRKPFDVDDIRRLFEHGATLEEPRLERLELRKLEPDVMETVLRTFNVSEVRCLVLHMVSSWIEGDALHTQLASLISFISKHMLKLKDFSCQMFRDYEGESEEWSNPGIRMIVPYLLPSPAGEELWPLPNLEKLEIVYDRKVDVNILKQLLDVVQRRLRSEDVPNIRSLLLHSSVTAVPDVTAFMSLINALELATEHFAIRDSYGDFDILKHKKEDDQEID